MTTSPTPELDRLIRAEPDLVDRIFEYILSEPDLRERIARERVEALKDDVRAEFKGEECYIAGMPKTKRQERVAAILSMFNGRNHSEVARRLNISRSTVKRVIQQAYLAKQAQFSGK